MKRYYANDGYWNDGPVFVQERIEGTREIEARPLPLHTEVRCHSPTGFAWGYGGSGPAQLALAILCDLVGAERAMPVYMRFKHDVIAKLPKSKGLDLTEQEVLEWLAAHEPPNKENAL